MRKILKVLFWCVGVLVGVGVAAAGYMLARKPAIAAPMKIRVEMTPERIARGRFLYTVADCDGCHSLRDFGRFGGPVVEGHRAEGFEFPKEMGLPGRVASRNITPDVETGIGAWTDGEKIRAIREGISRDGSPLFPMMPYSDFRNMSDDDVMSLVAFLNTLPPVKHAVPRSEIDFPVSVLAKSAPQPAGRVAPVDRSDRLKYGEYLVGLASCGTCHTQSEKG